MPIVTRSSLRIVSVDLNIGAETFRHWKYCKPTIVDKNQRTHRRYVGNNFSSYVRDYDFSVLLLEHNKNQPHFTIPEKFGVLHGNIFRHFVNSPEYRENFKKHR